MISMDFNSYSLAIFLIVPALFSFFVLNTKLHILYEC